jgi:hypothetical protein
VIEEVELACFVDDCLKKIRHRDKGGVRGGHFVLTPSAIRSYPRDTIKKERRSVGSQN